MRLKRTILLLLAAVLAMGTACRSVDINTPIRGTADRDMVTVNLLGEPPELNSMLTTDAVSGDVLRACMSGLIKLDGQDQPQPDIAESWEISSDNRTYTMHLRKDAVWSNGDPVTAEDFVYSWTYIMDASHASPFSFLLCENIKNGQAYYDGQADVSKLGVKAVDAYTLQVELEHPVPYALTLFSSFSYLPVNARAFEEIGAENYGKSPETIVTNGPYRLTEWVHDDHILVNRNENHYNAGEIFIPKLRFTMIKDNSAALNAFQAGEIDTTNITGEQMLRLQTENSSNVSTYYDNGSWFLRFNTENEFTGNEKVRKALGMGIDVEQLCSGVLKDGSVPADGYVPPRIAGAEGGLYADARGAVYTSDIQAARMLLEEGLAELGKTPAEVTLKYLSDDTTTSKLQAEYFKEQWKTNLGIEVQIETMPFKARLAATRSGDFDIVFSGWSPDFNDPMTYLSLLTSENSNNSGKYKSDRYDSLIVKAMGEADAFIRQELLVEAERLLMEDAPIVPLYFSCVPYAVSSKLIGMTRTGFQEYDFCDGAKIAQ